MFIQFRYMDMQVQKKKSSDKLISKKADSDEGVREMQITASAWSYRPFIQYRTSNQTGQVVPTLDKIGSVAYSKMDDGKETPVEKVGETGADITDSERMIRLYHSLLEYSATDQYLSEVTQSEYQEVNVSLQPYLFLQLESNLDEQVYVSIENPFRKEDTKGLLKACDSNQNVKVMYEGDTPVIGVNGKKYEMTHKQIVTDFDNLETKVMSALEKHSDTDMFLRSEYDGWGKIPVSNVEIENGEALIQTDEEHANWIFDEPILWDKTKEPIVKLLENFAHGDKDQLEYIYTRPTNPKMNTETSETKNHTEIDWEVALEEPSSKNSDAPFYVENHFLVRLFLYLGVFMISVIVGLSLSI